MRHPFRLLGLVSASLIVSLAAEASVSRLSVHEIFERLAYRFLMVALEMRVS